MNVWPLVAIHPTIKIHLRQKTGHLRGAVKQRSSSVSLLLLCSCSVAPALLTSHLAQKQEATLQTLQRYKQWAKFLHDFVGTSTVWPSIQGPGQKSPFSRHAMFCLQSLSGLLCCESQLPKKPTNGMTACETIYMNKNHAVKCCYLMNSFQELAESVGRQITWTGTFQKTEYCGDIFIFLRLITHKEKSWWLWLTAHKN